MYKIIDIIEKLHHEYSFSFILYYIKVHCVQAPLEAFMGLFLFIWSMICINPDLANNDLVIKMPLFTMLIVCFIYLCIINGTFVHKLYVLSTRCKKDANITYNEIERSFKSLSYFIHGLGTICYFGVALAVVLRLCGKSFFSDWHNIFLVCVGTLVGVIWNLRGYWGDMRIDWRKVFNGDKQFVYEESETIENVRRLKLTYTVKHITINVTTIVAMSVIYLVLVILSFNNESLLHVFFSFGAEEIGTYGFFVVAYVFVLIFYIKTLYPIFYIQKSSIYYQFNDLFSSP